MPDILGRIKRLALGFAVETEPVESGMAVADDGYDLVGYRARVGVTTTIQPAVRRILGGFGPLELDPGLSLPRYDLVASGSEWHVRRDGTTLQIDRTLQGAMGLLEWHLVAAALNHRRDLFHLHGAALSVPGGHGGIVLAGDSGSGKTTLTMGLTQRGFAPFADDVVLLDPVSLEVYPLRRAFRVSEETRRLLEPLPGETMGRVPDAQQEYYAPPHWGTVPVAARWLLFLEYQPGRAGHLVPLSPPEAAAAVLSKTSSLSREARLSLSTCARLTERAVCCRLFTGNLEASLAAVQELAATPLTASTASA